MVFFEMSQISPLKIFAKFVNSTLCPGEHFTYLKLIHSQNQFEPILTLTNMSSREK